MGKIVVVRGGVCTADDGDGGICGHKHKEHKDFREGKRNKGCKKCGCLAAGIY